MGSDVYVRPNSRTQKQLHFCSILIAGHKSRYILGPAVRIRNNCSKKRRDVKFISLLGCDILREIGSRFIIGMKKYSAISVELQCIIVNLIIRKRAKCAEFSCGFVSVSSYGFDAKLIFPILVMDFPLTFTKFDFFLY